MLHNYLEILYKSVKNRAFQIECEIQLLQEQFFFIDNLKGLEDRTKRLIFFKYSSLNAIHSIYEYYLENIQDYLVGPCPFKKAMQYHFAVICVLFNPQLVPSSTKDDPKKKVYFDKVQNCLITLQANQEAIKDLMGYDLYRCDGSIEKLIEALYFLFPYTELISLISDDNIFFTNLIKATYDYDCSADRKMESHVNCLKQVYKSFPTNWGKYNKETILAISEVLLSIFTFQQDNQNAQKNLECFEISERCKYLVKRNLEQISIKPDFISIIEKNLNYTPSKIAQDEKDKIVNICPLEYQNDQHSPIMCIHHVVLELRKLPLQPSVSFMCVVLMRTMNFLNTALCTEGKFVGADESFQFFVGALADARLYHLPKILDQMKMFIVSDLTVGKISFLISQLECAIDFIKTRILPVPQYILFPFKRDDIKMLHLVTPDEIESQNQTVNTTATSNQTNSNPKDSQKLYSYVDADINFDSDSNDGKLVLTGFVICAFPTFLRGKGQIPAVLFCTGNVQDKVVVYRYTLNNIDHIDNFFKSDLGPDYQPYGCVHGIIYHLSKKSDYRGFIHIDHQMSGTQLITAEDYATKIDDIAEFSNLILMLSESSQSSSSSLSSLPSSRLLSTLPPINGLPEIIFSGYVKTPEMLHLSNLPIFKEKYRIIWLRKKKTEGDKLASDDNSTSSARYYNQTASKNIPDQSIPISTFQTIMDLQLMLQKTDKLDHNYTPTGIIDRETVYAIIKTGLVDCQNFILTEKIYSDILNVLNRFH